LRRFNGEDLRIGPSRIGLTGQAKKQAAGDTDATQNQEDGHAADDEGQFAGVR
jgi:hypothetical protein